MTVLGAALIAPQTAQADDRYDRHHDQRHYDHREYHREYRRDYRGDYRRPDVVYAPPPVVYRPERSGISLFLPIEIH